VTTIRTYIIAVWLHNIACTYKTATDTHSSHHVYRANQATDGASYTIAVTTTAAVVVTVTKDFLRSQWSG